MQIRKFLIQHLILENNEAGKMKTVEIKPGLRQIFYIPLAYL